MFLVPWTQFIFVFIKFGIASKGMRRRGVTFVSGVMCCSLFELDVSRGEGIKGNEGVPLYSEIVIILIVNVNYVLMALPIS